MMTFKCLTCSQLSTRSLPLDARCSCGGDLQLKAERVSGPLLETEGDLSGPLLINGQTPTPDPTGEFGYRVDIDPEAVGRSKARRPQGPAQINDQTRQEQPMKIDFKWNCPLEIFPSVTQGNENVPDPDMLLRQVVIRHLDDESNDIELSPDEADKVAEAIKLAAKSAREARVALLEMP